MSLGRHRGAALIGRPLDISVQAVLDTQEDLAALCLDADVFYADYKLQKSRVQVTAEKTSPAGLDAVIRIRSAVLVDEPVVTLYLRLGCQQKTERRYVVLADLVSEAIGLPAVPLSDKVPVIVSSQVITSRKGAGGESALASADSSDNVGPGVANARSNRVERSTAARTVGRSAPLGADGAASLLTPVPLKAASIILPSASTSQRKKQSAKDRKTAANGNARLQLEALDLSSERDPSLRLSSELLSTPAASAQERSAAAALWRALTSQAQDVLSDAGKLQALENQVRTLQAQTLKNQLALDGLNQQLEQARSQRYANILVYTLAALLLFAIATLAYFLRRWFSVGDRRVDELPWWRKSEATGKGWANSSSEADVSSAAGASAGQKKSEKKKSDKTDKPFLNSGLDLNLDLDLGASSSMSPSGFGLASVRPLTTPPGKTASPPLSRRDRPDFAVSMTHPARAVKAEELFNVQQQADFFVSLGQHEQAIEVLHSHIGDNVQTSALVYLDLFNLYHQLKRKDDYEALRGDFNQLFNAKIPAFDFYNDSSPGLEAYQGALTRIEALWPSPKVLEVIEESIFRRPDANVEAFDLGAYRELLLLYAVAREIISPEAVSSNSILKFDLPEPAEDLNVPVVKFMATAIQPLSASVVDSKKYPRRPMPDSILPPSSPRLGLDLDLSTLGSESEGPPSASESDSKFFAQFVTGTAAMAQVPMAPPASVTSGPSARNSSLGNLIDFDAFDSSVNDSDKPKLPKS